MTVGGHFERVAAVYDSLRTTDEAPVRRIGQFLPDRPVTGLDIGCGTGRYTRLLRALLPEGSLLVASDVSAAMLAQLKAGDCGHAREVVPLLAAAEQLPLRAASLDLVTAFNCVHHFDLGRFLTAVARVLAPGGQLFIYTRTPQQNARTVWGRYFPGFTEHEQRLHSKAAFRDAVRRTGGLTVVAEQTFSHPRSSTAERLQAQAEGRHYSTFSLYTPEELRASTAAFLARLPRPEVCWADEHLLVVAGRSRNQVEPDGPGSLANQAITDQALQISAGRAGQAPQRRPGGRAQITPLCAQSIAGDDLRHSAQIGGSRAFACAHTVTRLYSGVSHRSAWPVDGQADRHGWRALTGQPRRRGRRRCTWRAGPARSWPGRISWGYAGQRERRLLARRAAAPPHPAPR